MNIPFVDLKAQYQVLKPEIDQQIQNVLNHGQFIMGPEVNQLEKSLSEFLKCKHSMACSSGTDAAILALMALGIGPGDEVITTAFSFVATIETIVLVGATPVLVDIDPVSFNIDPSKIKEAITSKTKAIVPVSLYGQPADMDEINDIASQHGLYVIEDAAQSFGAKYKNGRSGNLSLIGVTSFFPAKPLGCYGDGGAIFTNDDSLAEKIIQIRNHGQSQRYFHPLVGINGRLDTLQCAILIPKLNRYQYEIEQRQKIADRYQSELANLDIQLPKISDDRKSVWAQYTIKTKMRDTLQKRLQEFGVPTAVHYPTTMAEQPAYKNLAKVHDISRAIEASKVVMSLPMYPDMTDDIQSHIITSVRKSMN